MMRTSLLALALALIACNGNGGGDEDTDATTDSSGGDTGNNNTSTAQCDDDPATPAPGSGPATCLTAELSCGDSVTHTTTGGNEDLADGYQSGAWACIGSDPLTADYSGPERRYRFVAPDGVEPTVTLDSRCDLTMKIVRGESACPTDDTQVSCWDAEGDYTDRVQTHTFFPGLTYEIIVESVDGSEGAYTLSIDCP
ncbi:MAG: hypothetical protein EP330_25815 [Deltaproteobacteria bacterium]|nr:MAG: hypothetical protein EP330_25815 [Deltaproteobacteria bacterium]